MKKLLINVMYLTAWVSLTWVFLIVLRYIDFIMLPFHLYTFSGLCAWVSLFVVTSCAVRPYRFKRIKLKRKHKFDKYAENDYQFNVRLRMSRQLKG